MIRISIEKCGAIALIAILVAAGSAAAGYVTDGLLFWNNGSEYHDATTQNKVNVFANIQVADPQLADPYNVINPNWTPAITSPAVSPNGTIVYPVIHPADCHQPGCGPDAAGIVPVCYRGAVPPAEWGPDWTQGWIYTNFDGAGRTDIDYSKPIEVMSGSITSNTTWTNDSNYLMVGMVSVEDGATLTIEAGTVIFGDFNTIGFLNVQRGGKLIAIGTADAPIILTSDRQPGQMAPGDFGGLLMSGRAVANCADCLGGESCLSEGADVLYCGDDDCDDSGILRYVRIEYAGHEVAPDNELNSFTWNAVGTGTTLEYLNAFRGSDDLFEWFGGTVHNKYFVGMGGWDDGLDWQMGYRGSVQFAVIQMWGDGSDRGIEADNNEYDYNAPCRSNPVFSNITLVNTGGTTSTEGICLRRGTDAQIYNSIIMGWPRGIRIQHGETCAIPYPQPPLFCDAADVPSTEVASGFDIRTVPNPVVDNARFHFNLPESGRTRVSIFDIAGRQVDSLVDADLAAGSHMVSWNVPDNMPSGTYFYRIENNTQSTTGRFVTVR